MEINSIKDGTKYTIYTNIIQIVLGVLLTVIITNNLGPINYGLYQTILTILLLVVMISDFGLSSSVSKFISQYLQNHNKRSSIVITGLITKLIMTITLSSALMFLLPIVEKFLSVDLEEYLILMFISIVCRSMRVFLSKIFQGLRRLDLSARINSLYVLLNTITCIIFLYFGLGIKALLLSESISSLVVLIYGFGFCYKKGLFKEKFDKNILMTISKYAVPMFFIAISFYIYNKSDIIMIQYFLDAHSVGIYALAITIVSTLVIPLNALGQAAAPAYGSRGTIRSSESFFNIYKFTVLLSMPMSVGVFSISRPFILSIFGEQYIETVPVLELCCIFLFFYCLNSVSSPILDYLGYARLRSILIGITAVLNILLNYYLINLYGILGAVYSTVATYSIYALFVNIYIIILWANRDKKLLKKIIHLLLKTLLSVLIMYAVLLLLANLITHYIYLLSISVLVASIVYCGLVLIFKITSKKEVKGLFVSLISRGGKNT